MAIDSHTPTIQLQGTGIDAHTMGIQYEGNAEAVSTNPRWSHAPALNASSIHLTTAIFLDASVTANQSCAQCDACSASSG